MHSFKLTITPFFTSLTQTIWTRKHETEKWDAIGLHLLLGNLMWTTKNISSFTGFKRSTHSTCDWHMAARDMLLKFQHAETWNILGDEAFQIRCSLGAEMM